jgi:hypothetical protein
MARHTKAKLYIRRDAKAYRTAPLKLSDLPENEVFYLFWYEDGKRKAANVGRFKDAAKVALRRKERELEDAAEGIPTVPTTVVATVPEPTTTVGVQTVREAVQAYLDGIRDRV